MISKKRILLYIKVLGQILKKILKFISTFTKALDPFFPIKFIRRAKGVTFRV